MGSPRWWIDWRLARGLRTRYQIRSLLDVVRKRQEFEFKLQQAVKKDDVDAQNMALKYQYYLDTLDWVLHADL